MSTLQIDLLDSVNDRRLWVTLRDNLPLQDLIQKLVIDLELPQGEYELMEEKSKKVLPLDSTLKKQGILDESRLRLRKKKKAPVAIPIPIIPGDKVSAESPAKEQSQGNETEPLDKSQSKPPKKRKPEEEPAPKGQYGGEAYRPANGTNRQSSKTRRGKLPPPPAQQPGSPGTGLPGAQMPGGFWHRLLPQPPFLRWVPGWIWVYIRPIILVTILLVMAICCLLGIFVCRTTKSSVKCPTPLPPASNNINGEPIGKAVISPQDAPFTFHNEDCYESLVSGNVEVIGTFSSEEVIFSDLIQDFDQQEVIELSTVSEDELKTERELVLVAFNEGLKEGSNDHYAWLRDLNSGEDFLARVNLENNSMMLNSGSPSGVENWVKTDVREAVIYEQTEGICWYYTAYFAFNTDLPPFEITELRQALVYSFDSMRYYEELFSGSEGIEPIDGLVPRTVMQQELSSSFTSYHAPYDTDRAKELVQYVQNQGWLVDYPSMDNFIHPNYCNACEGSDVETDVVIRMWREGLGIGGSSIPTEPEVHWQPIRGSEQQLAYTYYGHSNYYTFVYNAINDGWIMMPSEAQSKVFDLLGQFANSSDLAERESLVQEIDYLILEEYAVILPLYYFGYCE